MTTGGILYRECEKNNFDFVQIPSITTKSSISIFVVPLLFILLRLGKISDKFISRFDLHLCF